MRHLPAVWLLTAFATAQDLYALLNTTSSASAKDIRKAYHRAALTTHPDKVRLPEQRSLLSKKTHHPDPSPGFISRGAWA